MNNNSTPDFAPVTSHVLQSLVVDVATRVFDDSRDYAVSHKADGSLVTFYDTALQREIMEALHQQWPDIPLLGEEMDLPEQRRVMSNQAYWCLDPLDGTTNFAHGIPFYGVSLALVQGGVVVAGVVYDPSHQECFRADAGKGAWLNDQPLRLAPQDKPLKECVALVDFKRLPKSLIWKIGTSQPYRSQRSLGSVALEWCWLASNRAQLYLHGAQRIWDYAAGLLIFKEAGGCGCIMDLVTGRCLETDRDIEAHAAIGASQQMLLQQWKDWLYAPDAD